MASVTKQDIPEMAGFMKDFWTFIKSFWQPEDNDEYFDSLIRDGDAIWFKYDRDPLMRKLLEVFIVSRGEAINK